MWCLPEGKGRAMLCPWENAAQISTPGPGPRLSLEAEFGLVCVHFGEGLFHFPPPSAQRIQRRKGKKEEKAKGRKSPSRRQRSAFGSGHPPPSLFLPTDFIYFT